MIRSSAIGWIGRKLSFAAALVMVLSGCASVDLEESIVRINQASTDFTAGQLVLAQTQEQQEILARTTVELLARPIGQAEAVQLALVNNPLWQMVLAEYWSNNLKIAESGQLENPLLALSRIRFGSELDWERTLSIGLFDLLSFPRRQRVAQKRTEALHWQLVATVVELVTQVRQSWVRAVAAEQGMGYAKQVLDSAEASAALAQRMQKAGNWNHLNRLKQQAFYVEATLQWRNAQQMAVTTREDLVRLLGLSDGQVRQMQLPDRLPELPKFPRDSMEVSALASLTRLDIRVAQLSLAATAEAQGLTTLKDFTDVEVGVRHDTQFDEASGTRATGRGAEISLRLPILNGSSGQHAIMRMELLAKAAKLESAVRAAESNLRESFAAYQAAYSLAHYYRDDVLPLRRKMADENLLLYNGMLIGVFDLLADARDQIGGVLAALRAEERFWLADAALKAALIGKPMPRLVTSTQPEDKASSYTLGEATHE